MKTSFVLVNSLNSDSKERIEFEGKLEFYHIDYEVNIESRSNRLGYGYELIHYYVDVNNLENIRQIKNQIISNDTRSTITKPKWGLIILIIIFFILLVTKYL